MQDYFFVKKNNRLEKIDYSTLIYVKGMRGYMQLVTESQVYFVLNTIEEVQNHLPPELFCRIHKSYIVALKRVQCFDNWKIILEPLPGEKQYSELANRRELPVGRAFRKRLRESVVIIPNRMNKYVKKVLAEADFLMEYGHDDE